MSAAVTLVLSGSCPASIHTAVVITRKMLADMFRRLCLDRSKLRQGRENARAVPSVQRVSLFL